MEKLTEAELAGLSEEERAAIADDDDTDPEDRADTEAEEVAAEEDDVAEGEDEPVLKAESETDDAAVTVANVDTGVTEVPIVAGDGAKTEVVAKVTPDNEDDLISQGAVNTVVWPEKYKERMDALKVEREEITRKFSDGEVTLEEKEREQDRIEEDRHNLRSAQQRAEIQNDAFQAQVAVSWRESQQTFFKSNPEYGKNRTLLSAFDAYVREEGANPDNSNRNGDWFLQRAHERVQEDLVVLGVKPAAAVKPVVVPRAKPNLSTVPKTLGALPAAQGSEIGANAEFANIDKLSGIDLENALARLTPDQERRYLQQS